jgi:hypothetical protein
MILSLVAALVLLTICPTCAKVFRGWASKSAKSFNCHTSEKYPCNSFICHTYGFIELKLLYLPHLRKMPRGSLQW